jgi:hypothetical protein
LCAIALANAIARSQKIVGINFFQIKTVTRLGLPFLFGIGSRAGNPYFLPPA